MDEPNYLQALLEEICDKYESFNGSANHNGGHIWIRTRNEEIRFCHMDDLQVIVYRHHQTSGGVIDDRTFDVLCPDEIEKFIVSTLTEHLVKRKRKALEEARTARKILKELGHGS